MSYVIPSTADFKSFFTRDFPFGTDVNLHVLDSDLTRASAEVSASINEGLFPSQEVFDIGFNYLTAHNLVVNIRNSTAGLSGQYEWAQASKSVGSVSVGLAIPQDILNDPQFAWLTQTTYGAKYLEMVYPLLKGLMFAVEGSTSA